MAHDSQVSSAAQTSSPQSTGHAPQSLVHDAQVSSAPQTSSPHDMGIGTMFGSTPWHEASRTETINAAPATTIRSADPGSVEVSFSPIWIKIIAFAAGVIQASRIRGRSNPAPASGSGHSPVHCWSGPKATRRRTQSPSWRGRLRRSDAAWRHSSVQIVASRGARANRGAHAGRGEERGNTGRFPPPLAIVAYKLDNLSRRRALELGLRRR